MVNSLTPSGSPVSRLSDADLHRFVARLHDVDARGQVGDGDVAARGRVVVAGAVDAIDLYGRGPTEVDEQRAVGRVRLEGRRVRLDGLVGGKRAGIESNR